MNETEKPPRTEAPRIPESAPETPASPDDGRAVRRQEIERVQETLEPLAKSPKEIGGFQRQKEQGLNADIASIEAMLDVPVSEESKAIMRRNVVEDSVASASAQHEKLIGLRRESAALAADEAIEKILTFDSPEMQAVGKRTKDGPMTIGSREDGLEVVGTAHSSDPESRTVKEVQRLRDEFIAEIPKEDALFMVEGVYNPADLTPEGLTKILDGVPDEAAAVRKFGEKGALLWTAKERGIEVTSPEKPQDAIVADLDKQGYSKEEIGLYLVMRQFTSEIGQPHPGSTAEKTREAFAPMLFDLDRIAGTKWVSVDMKDVEAAISAGDKKALDALMTKVIADYADGANAAFAKIPGMESRKLIPSVEGLLKRNDGVASEEMIPMDAVNALHDPRSTESRINKVSAAWNGERDKHLVRQIAEARTRGKKPLVVYGASHAIAVEPALKAMQEKTQ